MPGKVRLVHYTGPEVGGPLQRGAAARQRQISLYSPRVNRIRRRRLLALTDGPAETPPGVDLLAPANLWKTSTQSAFRRHRDSEDSLRLYGMTSHTSSHSLNNLTHVDLYPQ